MVKQEHKRKPLQEFALLGSGIAGVMAVVVFSHQISQEQQKADATKARAVFQKLERGQQMLHQSDYSNALRVFRQVMEDDPNNAVVHRCIGNVLWEQGQFDQSLAEHRTALSLDPTYADAAFNLANGLWSTGKHDEAVAEWRHTLALNPEYATAHNGIADALLYKKDGIGFKSVVVVA